MKKTAFCAIVEDDRWLSQMKSLEEHVLKIATLAYVAAERPKLFKQKTVEANIIMTDDKTVQHLNHEYRNKNKTTNVLSFPQIDMTAPEGLLTYEKLPAELPLQLGDIFIAYETVLDEAQKQHKKFKSHFSHLIIHGILHLLGYDHLEEEEATVMENLERSLMNELGYDDPYKDLEDIKTANE